MALLLSRSALVAFSSSLPKKPLTSSLWRSLCELGIARYKPTRRGCRAGTRKQRPLLTCEWPPFPTSLSDHSLCEIHPEIPLPSKELQVGNNLHIPPSKALNIHLCHHWKRQFKLKHLKRPARRAGRAGFTGWTNTKITLRSQDYAL